MNLDLLSKLDPEKFTIEEIMAIYGWWRWWAKLIMKTGIKQGHFSFSDGYYKWEGRPR
jgi:hypothetical protein